jgi:lysophospholipase L1-like esterase
MLASACARRVAQARVARPRRLLRQEQWLHRSSTQRRQSTLACVDDPRTVLCFGDSNTWGHDAESGVRFGPSTRWPGVLASTLDNVVVLEEGLNGRTTVFDDPCCTWLAPNVDPGVCNGRKALMPILHSAKPIDCVVIALGVNDLKWRFSATPCDIANGAGLLVDDVRLSGSAAFHPTGPALLDGSPESASGAPAVVLVCPPPISNEEVFPDFRGGGVERSEQLAAEFQRVAEEKGVPLVLGESVEGCVASELDGIHLTAAAHSALGLAIAKAVDGALER